MKPYVTDTDGVIYRPEFFQFFAPTTDGKFVNGYFVQPYQGRDYTRFPSAELNFGPEPTLIPAQAGYFLLEIFVSETGRFQHLTRDPIIAWQVTSSGRTPIGLETGLNEKLYILRPDGIVQKRCSRYECEADYVQNILYRGRKAGKVIS